MTSLIIDILGWIGSALLIIAYWFVSRNKLQPKSVTYQGLNIVGSALLIVNTVYYGAYPSTGINIVWIIIGAYYLFEASKTKGQAITTEN